MDLACARNPWTGKGTAKKPSKRQTKPKNEHTKKVDVSTLLLLTRSHAHEVARVRVFLETLGPLRIPSLSLFISDYNNRLADAIAQVNSLHDNGAARDLVDGIFRRGWPPNLTASLFVDATLENLRDVKENPDKKHFAPVRFANVACPVNWPDLHSTFMRVMATQNSIVTGLPMAHIFRKFLPRGSAARNCGGVLREYMDESRLLTKTINDMVICSLVGNYAHSPTRMTLLARQHVYSWFRDPDPLDRTFAHLVKSGEFLTKCWRFYIYAVRDYMIYMLEDDPIARKHFDARYDYKNFKAITQDTIAWMRKYVETNLLDGGTLLTDSLNKGKAFKEINAEYAKAHARMLKVQSKSAPMPFFKFLGGVRGAAPVDYARIRKQIEAHREDTSDIIAQLAEFDLNTDNDVEEESEDQRRKREEAEEKKEEAEVKANLDIFNGVSISDRGNAKALTALMKVLALGDEDAAMESKDRKKPSNISNKKKKQQQLELAAAGGVRLTKQGLTITSSKAIFTVMCKYDYEMDHDDVFDDFLRKWILLFGADQAGVDEIRRIAQIYFEGTTPISTLKQIIYSMSRAYPFTWALINGAWVAHNSHRNMRMYWLDYSTARDQQAAMCVRFSVKDIADVPPTAFRMCICMGCRSSKSWVKDPHKATSKETYSFGLNNASINLYTDQCYCRSNKSFMHFQCGVQEIKHVILIGQVFTFDSRVYFHCPQKKGGHIGIFNAAHMAFNDMGMACYACTLEIEKEKHLQLLKQHPLGPTRERKCFLCNKKIAKPTNKVIYGKDTLMCPKCHTVELMSYLHRELPPDVIELCMTDHEAELRVRAAIIERRTLLRANYKGQNEARHNRVRAQAKKNTWAKSRN